MTKTLDQFELIPPFCPNSSCRFHYKTGQKFYVKNGFSKTHKPPFFNQRFKCKECFTQFSSNTFGIDFRKRHADLGERTLSFSLNGMSNNSIAKILNVNEGTVRNRLRTLSVQALLFDKIHTPPKLDEDVAFDGFETFTHSQFSPCYVNTAVGSRSLFVYFNTFSPLNRKGRMTKAQKLKNQHLQKLHGAYPRDSVYEESVFIIKCLERMKVRTLFTDEHKSYARAIKTLQPTLRHITISSKARRDPTNPLFPINHLHLHYRHFMCSQKRETIAFQKHEAALMEKIVLMKVYRNFMSTKFVKKIKFDPHAHEWSPAMYLGITKRVLSFNEVFGLKIPVTKVHLGERELNFIRRHYPYSRQKIAA